MSTIDHDFLVTAVQEATRTVFSTMLGMELQDVPAYVNKGTAAKGNDGLLAFVGLAGSWAGMGAIGCSATFACRICSAFLMDEYAAMNDEVLDAMAEVTNMVIGNVKTTLEDRLGAMGLSIPTVIYARNFTSRTLNSAEWTVVPFEFEGERLIVEICLVRKKDVGTIVSSPIELAV